MGRIFTSHLEGRVYSCKFCKAHLANVEEVVSKVERRLLIFSHFQQTWPSRLTASAGFQSFHCRDGKAYLFNTVVNIRSGKFLTDDIWPVVSVMACKSVARQTVHPTRRRA